jgi:hypothetical protein
MLIMLKLASVGDSRQIRPQILSPKLSGKFEIATHGDGAVADHHSCHAKQDLVGLPLAAFEETCIVPIWVTSVTPSMPIQVAANQLPGPSPPGSTSGTFHWPKTHSNVSPAGACVTVPDQVPFVPFASGRGRSARLMPGTSSSAGWKTGAM